MHPQKASQEPLKEEQPSAPQILHHVNKRHKVILQTFPPEAFAAGKLIIAFVDQSTVLQLQFLQCLGNSTHLHL